MAWTSLTTLPVRVTGISFTKGLRCAARLVAATLPDPPPPRAPRATPRGRRAPVDGPASGPSNLPDEVLVSCRQRVGKFPQNRVDMFLAWRELAFARTRFLLMGAVVALTSVLVVLLSGLSTGLVNDGVSGLQRMPADAFAFMQNTRTDAAFTRSTVDLDQVAAW